MNKAAFVLFLLAAPVHAEGWKLAVLPTVNLPILHSAQVFTPSPGLRVDLDYGFKPWFSLGTSLGYDTGFRMQGRTVTHTDGDVDNDGLTDVVRFTSKIRAPFLGFALMAKFHQHFSLFGRTLTLTESGGGGFYNLWTTAGYLEFSGRASSGMDMTGTREFMPASNHGYAGSVWGLALELPVTGRLSAGAAVRYEDISNHDFDAFLATSLILSYAL